MTDWHHNGRSAPVRGLMLWVGGGVVAAGIHIGVFAWIFLSVPAPPSDPLASDPLASVVMIDLSPVAESVDSNDEQAVPQDTPLPTDPEPVPVAEPEPEPEPELEPEPEPEDVVAPLPAPPRKPVVKAVVRKVETAPIRRTDPIPAERSVSAAPSGQVVSERSSPSAESVQWSSRVMMHLERRKRYPSGARERREQGIVYVRFTIDDGGQVLSVLLEKTSGFSDLDNEVLALVQRASPVPSPPPGAARSIVAPIKFTLR